jgi:TonB-linked SusC/RagA family outer membrane protein
MHFKTTAIYAVILSLAKDKQRNTKLLRVMKLTAILLLAACIQVSANTQGQTVTLKVKDAPVKAVLKEIQKQTGLDVLIDQSILQKTGKVSLNVKDMPVTDVLNICFKNEALTYSIEDGRIVIKPKPASPNADGGSEQLPPPIDITGKVTDADGNPLIGATVKVKGSSKGTTTNNDGVFVLKAVDENATLEISFVGYETYTVAVNNKSAIVANLKLKPESLNEVVINKGYYTEKQKYSVGDVGKVTAKDIEQQPVSNPILALQGRVPGLVITQATGLSGSAVKVKIQGQNSINRGGDPLYVIDGVPYSSQLVMGLASILGTSGSTNNLANYGSPLSYLNPMDIESIEVLKDADATSIYGSRAANGAILVTTKRGKSGKVRFNATAQSGIGEVANRLPLLNTQQYLEMRHEAKANDGEPIYTTDYDINGFWDTTRHTDWQDKLIGGKAKYLDLQSNVSGGTKNYQFSVGSGFHKETTVFPIDYDDKKAMFHVSMNSISDNEKFRIQFNANYVLDNNTLPAIDLTARAVLLAPDAPELYNQDGSINWATTSTGSTTWGSSGNGNPIAQLQKKYKNTTNNLIAGTNLNYEIFKGLTISTNLGFTNLQSDEISLSPFSAINPADRPTSNRTSTFANSKIDSWLIEPQMTYKRKIGSGNLEAFLGGSVQRQNNRGQIIQASGFTNDLVMKDMNAASTLRAGQRLASEYKYEAVFGRLNYILNDRYILNITARRDGSSRFGWENQFHNFGSVGGAWIFSNDRFFNKFSFLSFGKIKLSYGTTGNDQIGDYQFLNLYNPFSVGIPYQGVIGLAINNHSNPYLQWEETKKLQAGIDLAFWKEKIVIALSAYRNRSSNQLLNYFLPNLTGFSSVFRNLPATVQNSGLEVSLSSKVFDSKHFKWNSSFNVTFSKNKLASFPDFEKSGYASSYVLGKPISLIRAYKFHGVNPITGTYSFEKSDKTIVSVPDYSTDRTELIYTAPAFFGGWQNSFSYKGFNLDFMFQFVRQKGGNYWFGNFPGTNNSNQPIWVMDRWQKSGDVASHQLVSSTYNLGYDEYDAAQNSSANYGDASFIRFKNISLSWSIPQKSLSRLRIQEFKIFMNGQNISTFTNYKGLDPETLSSSTLPPLRVYTFGIQLTL